MTAADCVAACIAALNQIGNPFMVVGSFSSNVYGVPRSTKDADFVIQSADAIISKFAAAIGPSFVLEPQFAFETVTGTSRFHFTHADSGFIIEFFNLTDDPHDQQRFQRRVRGEIGGQSTYIPTAEDVIITKLRWSKHGSRQKDIADIRGILAVQKGRLNLEYIAEWADHHGTRDVLDPLLEE